MVLPVFRPLLRRTSHPFRQLLAGRDTAFLTPASLHTASRRGLKRIRAKSDHNRRAKSARTSDFTFCFCGVALAADRRMHPAVAAFVIAITFDATWRKLPRAHTPLPRFGFVALEIAVRNSLAASRATRRLDAVLQFGLAWTVGPHGHARTIISEHARCVNAHQCHPTNDTQGEENAIEELSHSKSSFWQLSTRDGGRILMLV